MVYPSCSRLPDVPSVEQLLVGLAERDALIVALVGRVAELAMPAPKSLRRGSGRKPGKQHGG